MNAAGTLYLTEAVQFRAAQVQPAVKDCLSNWGHCQDEFWLRYCVVKGFGEICAAFI
jgi:hypothetical protein